jgi:superfamily I DNA and/or RNA helicase
VSEAETLCDIACSILADQANAPMLPTIGIITPFRMQNNAISHMLDARLDVRLRHCILVDTVERFQGSECDVILYGTAVTTLQEFDTIRSEVDIDGHTVDRKLNVAITRAKEQFVLVGNARILVESAVYRQFLLYLRQRQWPS